MARTLVSNRFLRSWIKVENKSRTIRERIGLLRNDTHCTRRQQNGSILYTVVVVVVAGTRLRRFSRAMKDFCFFLLFSRVASERRQCYPVVFLCLRRVHVDFERSRFRVHTTRRKENKTYSIASYKSETRTIDSVVFLRTNTRDRRRRAENFGPHTVFCNIFPS